MGFRVLWGFTRGYYGVGGLGFTDRRGSRIRDPFVEVPKRRCIAFVFLGVPLCMGTTRKGSGLQVDPNPETYALKIRYREWTITYVLKTRYCEWTKACMPLHPNLGMHGPAMINLGSCRALSSTACHQGSGLPVYRLGIKALKTKP